MEKPLKITFRDMEPSAAIEADVRDKVAKLEELYDRITGCRVVIEQPHRHRHQGKLIHVRIDLTVPGKELVVSHEPPDHAHEDAYVAVRDAFHAMKRQLEDHVRVVRGDTKSHEAPPPARVVRLFPEEGYGFIETADGREVYFHRNAVVDEPFEHLAVGVAVRFVETTGEKGPQASTVHAIRKSS